MGSSFSNMWTEHIVQHVHKHIITSEVTVRETRFLLDKLLCALDNLLTVSISTDQSKLKNCKKQSWNKVSIFFFEILLPSTVAQFKQKPSKVFQKLPQRWYQYSMQNYKTFHWISHLIFRSLSPWLSSIRENFQQLFWYVTRHSIICKD